MGIFGSKSAGGGGKKKAGGAGKSGQSQITEKDRAVLDLKNARDRMRRYRKRLSQDAEKMDTQARELLRSGQRDRALLLVKLKRHKEKECTKIEGQLLRVHEMIEDIEWESQQMQVLQALQSGTAALNAIHSEMSVDDVEALMADTQEAIDMENQISGLLTGASFSSVDEDEILAELAMLEEQQGVEEGTALPEAPTNAVQVGGAVRQQQQQKQAVEEERAEVVEEEEEREPVMVPA